MNVLFFLTPKEDVAYILEEYSVKEVLEIMEQHRYTSIPVINKEGHYIGTITEGDMLWSMKNLNLTNENKIKEFKNSPVTNIKRRRDNSPISIDSKIEDLLSKSVNQNFVPVVDDQDVFIGIIKRSDIISYFVKKNNLEVVSENF
ncbi:MAG: CBS domain-containing protein [Clostridioides sp.]|nr:CBS domain-containing protein [Clostridioides sp.]